MKVFIDEDCGTSIPKALKSVRVPCDEIVYPSNRPPVRFGTKDPIWIPWAGDNGYLALSQNQKILENPTEFELLRSHRLGVVFVNNGEYPVWQILRMFLNRWAWFEEIDRQSKPFVFLVGLTGSPVPFDLSNGPRTPRPFRAPSSLLGI